MGEPVLVLDRLTAYNRTDPALLMFGRRKVAGVLEVSLSLAAGETLVLLGESGSGRSTLLRVVAGIQPAGGGRILLGGEDVTRRERHPRIVLVPQDPRLCLVPDRPFAEAVAAELGPAGSAQIRERLGVLLRELGLDPGFLDRAPATCSGGQVQRLALARALALEPTVLLLDEPVSGVDPHTAERVIRLIRAYQQRRGTAVLMATHDLSLARRLAHRAAVLLAGRLVEQGPVAEVLADPLHPHTRQLLGVEEERRAPDPDLAEAPPGCPLTGRCPLVTPRCHAEFPPLRPVASGRQAACHAL